MFSSRSLPKGRSNFRGKKVGNFSRSFSKRPSVRRFNKKRKFIKKKKKFGVGIKPKWFQTLMRQQTPSKFVQKYQAQISAVSGFKTPFTSPWCNCPSMIQNVLSVMVASGSTSAASFNTVKNYLTDVNVHHEWRNNSDAEQKLELYKCVPRYRIPVQADGGSETVILSGGTDTANDGITTGTGVSFYYRDFIDQGKGVSGANKILYNDLETTPYMSPKMTCNFKITPLIGVKWPNPGRAGYLKPGQTAELDTKQHYKSPLMVSYNKYQMDGTNSNVVYGMWQVVENTPVIFGYLKGTIVHGTAGNPSINAVDSGPAWVDYQVTLRGEAWQFEGTGATITNVSTNVIALTAEEQVLEATGAIATSVLA